jgi:hypothetical protein
MRKTPRTIPTAIRAWRLTLESMHYLGAPEALNLAQRKLDGLHKAHRILTRWASQQTAA